MKEHHTSEAALWDQQTTKRERTEQKTMNCIDATLLERLDMVPHRLYSQRF